MTKQRILVAMSGGIDSSVAAIKLHEAGHEVFGVTLKTWNYGTSCSIKKQIGCCNLNTINDAREVATYLGITHTVIDVQQEFGKHVIDPLIKTYMKGLTPNPCIACNGYIKWGALLQRADELGCDALATGHYARIRQEGGRYILYTSQGGKKDQTYALWMLSQDDLRRTRFILGDHNKEEVRRFAIARGFSHLAKKPESYEICFIPDNDYRGFLKRKVKNLESTVAGGEFVLEDGTVVGHHQGYPFYTVGQRKGLNLSLGYPVYVKEIQADKNRIVVGSLDTLLCDGMYVEQLNMIKYPQIDAPMEAIVKIRYNDTGHKATITQEKERLTVRFHQGVHAVAPGQAAVCYTAAGDVIVGGWITASFKKDPHEHPKA